MFDYRGLIENNYLDKKKVLLTIYQRKTNQINVIDLLGFCINIIFSKNDNQLQMNVNIHQLLMLFSGNQLNTSTFHLLS